MAPLPIGFYTTEAFCTRRVATQLLVLEMGRLSVISTISPILTSAAARGCLLRATFALATARTQGARHSHAQRSRHPSGGKTRLHDEREFLLLSALQSGRAKCEGHTLRQSLCAAKNARCSISCGCAVPLAHPAHGRNVQVYVRCCMFPPCNARSGCRSAAQSVSNSLHFFPHRNNRHETHPTASPANTR